MAKKILEYWCCLSLNKIVMKDQMHKNTDNLDPFEEWGLKAFSILTQAANQSHSDKLQYPVHLSQVQKLMIGSAWKGQEDIWGLALIHEDLDEILHTPVPPGRLFALAFAILRYAVKAKLRQAMVFLGIVRPYIDFGCSSHHQDKKD